MKDGVIIKFDTQKYLYNSAESFRFSRESRLAFLLNFSPSEYPYARAVGNGLKFAEIDAKKYIFSCADMHSLPYKIICEFLAKNPEIERRVKKGGGIKEKMLNDPDYFRALMIIILPGEFWPRKFKCGGHSFGESVIWRKLGDFAAHAYLAEELAFDCLAAYERYQANCLNILGEL